MCLIARRGVHALAQPIRSTGNGGGGSRLELRHARGSRLRAVGLIATRRACNVNGISAATAARGLELRLTRASGRARGRRRNERLTSYRYPSACNVNSIAAATAARGLELRRLPASGGFSIVYLR